MSAFPQTESVVSVAACTRKGQVDYTIHRRPWRCPVNLRLLEHAVEFLTGRGFKQVNDVQSSVESI